MRDRRRLALFSVPVLALVVLGGVLYATRDSDDPSPRGIELAGMRLSDRELDELARDSMGATLDDVEIATPDDEAPSRRTGTVAGGIRSFELTARPIRWEYRDGQEVAAWSYDGQVPGPVLEAIEGEQVRVTITNRLPAATSVHWHGVDVPWQQDGVPGVTQAAIEPDERRTYSFRATPAGTRWYHTHGSGDDDESSQLDMGLSGALVIRPATRPAASGDVDVDATLVLDDWIVGSRGYNAAMMPGHGAHDATYNVFTINGRSAPDVPDIEVQRGQRVRLRLVNASTMSYHPMHLHGHQFRVTALDGNTLDQPITRNVLLLAPGETADVEFVADNPGAWMFHCHDLHHADAGMHQLVRYEGIETVGEPDDDSHEADA